MPLTSRSTPVLALVAAAVLAGGTGGAVAAGMVTGAQIKNGTVTGVDVKNRSLAAQDLSRQAARSLRGASAHGLVSDDGEITRQSGGVKVTHPTTGLYCIKASGLSPATSVIVANADFATDDTSVVSFEQNFAVARSSSNTCPGTAFPVTTLLREANGELSLSDAPFTFVIG